MLATQDDVLNFAQEAYQTNGVLVLYQGNTYYQTPDRVLHAPLSIETGEVVEMLTPGSVQGAAMQGNRANNFPSGIPGYSEQPYYGEPTGILNYKVLYRPAEVTPGVDVPQETTDDVSQPRIPDFSQDESDFVPDERLTASVPLETPPITAKGSNLPLLVIAGIVLFMIFQNRRRT